MSKAKSKRKITSRSSSRKTKVSNSASPTTARKTARPKSGTRSVADKRPRPSSQRTERTGSKQARIIAMLRAPGGATIEAMAHKAGWQPHSVRGFLAGVVRKKLGLNLVSSAAESGRIYRVTDRTALAAVTAKTSHAA